MPDVILDHDRLQVVVDRTTGAFRQIIHRHAGLSLISQSDVAAQHPFMVIMADGAIRRTWQECVVEAQDARTVQARWTLDDELLLSARLSLDLESGDLHCWINLQNPGNVPVAAVAYPYIAGIGRLGDDPDGDELTHPYATGFLVRNPRDNLPPVLSETEGQQPVVLGLYPEGFSGSTMQFMAYSAVGRGGFYVAAEDSEGHEKWLNAYRHPDGDVRMTIWHGPVDYALRRYVDPEYPTIVAALPGGSWYDAADRYKSWALAQPWVARGPLWARAERSRWLLEQVGFCTFGINARHDRSAWLAEIDRIAGVPGLHLSGPNWPRIPADYRNNLPGGLADWFPTQFHPANLEVIRQNHDYLVPFEFNLLFGRGEDRAAQDAGQQALQIIPAPTLSRDAYHFPFLCPTSSFTQHLHIARDRRLVEEVQIDGIYYDISVNNVRHICLSTDHQHEPGDTLAITRGYRELLSQTAAAMQAAAGGTVIPIGTEMINEQMLPTIDFYQARAEASPAAPFEAEPFRHLLARGVAEKIPLFAYVYHEYGPVRLDGWAKLSREQGEYVYFILGRVLLQGGLIELNYEFSALEDLDGIGDTATEHYWSFDERHYRIDPDVAAYVGHLARARVGPANCYLAYGTMLRPAPLLVDGEPVLQLDYFSYNAGQNSATYAGRGTQAVPAVLQVAWRHRDESAAWLLLNLAREDRTVHLDLDSSAFGIAGVTTWELTRHQQSTDPLNLGYLTGRRTVDLTLPSRYLVMIEALPARSMVPVS